MGRWTTLVAALAVTAFLGCQAAEEPVETSSAETEVVGGIEEAAEIVLDEEWFDLSEDLMAFLQESATLGGPVGEGTVEIAEEPCCSKVESQVFSLEATGESALAAQSGMLFRVTCELTCTGTGYCTQYGCQPSPTFGTCTQFNCGECTGTCRQVISTHAATAEALDLAISSAADEG